MLRKTDSLYQSKMCSFGINQVIYAGHSASPTLSGCLPGESDQVQFPAIARFQPQAERYRDLILEIKT